MHNKNNKIRGFEIIKERIDVIKKVALEDFGLQVLLIDK
jgi:hypothetical protein